MNSAKRFLSSHPSIRVYHTVPHGCLHTPFGQRRWVDTQNTQNWLMLKSRFHSLTVPVGRESVSGVCKDVYQLGPCGTVGAPYSTA